MKVEKDNLEVILSEEELVQEHNRLMNRYWDTPTLSPAGIRESVSAIAHTLTKGKLGEPSILSQAADIFIKRYNLSRLQLDVDMQKLEE